MMYMCLHEDIGMEDVLIQMHIFANQNFWFAKICFFYITGSISRFLLKSQGFETSTSSFILPRS